MSHDGGIEAFKLRHIRQNRELARMNTLYALHIRKLQKEMELLRDENLSLRHELLPYRLAREKAQTMVCQANDVNASRNEPESTPEPNDESIMQIDHPPSSPTESASNNRRRHPPKCYTLPSVKSKLRKGDPFTFGN